MRKLFVMSFVLFASATACSEDGGDDLTRDEIEAVILESCCGDEACEAFVPLTVEIVDQCDEKDAWYRQATDCNELACEERSACLEDNPCAQ